VRREQIYRVIFILAGVYNIAFGLWAALDPHALFDAFELGPPSHSAVWACLGMVVGLYGLIYLAVAFTDPARRLSAAIVLGRRVEYDFTRFLIGIGLLGKILGPIGFVLAVRGGELPLRMIPLIALDDLIWWVPFAMYLIDGTQVAAALGRQAPRIAGALHVAAAAATFLWIRGGSEAEADPAARGAFVAAHADTWRAAWFLWMAAAAALGGFFCWWAARSPKPRLARVALIVGFAGLFADFFADALFIGWLPERYENFAPFTTMVSEVVANGLYSIAGALLMFASPSMRPWFRTWGWTVWIAGFALAGAGAVRWDAAIVVAAGLLLATFTPWVWFANRFLGETL
jgi:hypothetical protein